MNQPKPGDKFIYRSKRKTSIVNNVTVEFIKIEDGAWLCRFLTGQLKGDTAYFNPVSLTYIPTVWNKPKE